MKKSKQEPQRTCLGCRQPAGKRELIRVVRTSEGKALVDETLRAPGRGAYVHRDDKCIELAFSKRALQRSLKMDMDQETIEMIKKDILQQNK